MESFPGTIAGPVTWGPFIGEDETIPAPPAPDPTEASSYSPEEGVVTATAITTQQFSNIGGPTTFGVSFADFETTCKLTIPNGDGDFWVIFTYPLAGCLPSSTFSYRLPYEDGTQIIVTGDDLTHPAAPGRYDMHGDSGEDEYTIVAARAGRIEKIVDTHPKGSEENNYMWLSHGWFNDDDSPVWQPQEWTKYSHLVTGSVPDELAEGTMVAAGDELGTEGDVGAPGAVHLHFEVAGPDDPLNPISPSGFVNGENRIPSICTPVYPSRTALLAA